MSSIWHSGGTTLQTGVLITSPLEDAFFLFYGVLPESTLCFAAAIAHLIFSWPPSKTPDSIAWNQACNLQSPSPCLDHQTTCAFLLSPKICLSDFMTGLLLKSYTNCEKYLPVITNKWIIIFKSIKNLYLYMLLRLSEPCSLYNWWTLLTIFLTCDGGSEYHLPLAGG